MTSALATRDLAAGYRGRLVLEHVDLDVAPGTFVALLGRNGAGKSSLLRTIAGMQSALAGCVEVQGQRIDRMTAADRARRVGVVLTERTVIASLTARRIVEWGRYPHVGWSGRLSTADHEAVDRALEAAGAEALADRDCDTLSDGEYQRVHVARALAQEPDILLLDEPTAFLDAPGRLELMATLRRLANPGRLTVVVATHEVEVALRVADVVWLAADDHHLNVGSPSDLVASGQLRQTFGEATMASLPRQGSISRGGLHA